MTEPDEVVRLRARVAELEAQVTHADQPPAAAHPHHRSVWLSVGSALLLALACVLAPLSVTSVWASSQLSDTEQYVQTVAPLADDPAVQAAIADEVTTAVMENVDVEGVTTDLLDTLAAQDNVPPRVAAALPGLAVPIANGIESFTRTQVGNVLASPQFAAVWEQVNRIAHTQVVKLLEGNAGGAVSAQGDTITLNLAPIIDQVKQRLLDQGFTLAQNIPTVDRNFVLVESGSISDAQGTYQLLNNLGTWLPLVALALFAAGVALAGNRRRALLKGALGVAGAMVALGAVLAIARMWYVGATPADVLTEQAAGSVFDTLVRFLRTGLRAVGVLALLVALAAFLTGPSAGAVRTRTALEGGIGSLRGSAESSGWSPGRVGIWTSAHKGALRLTTFLAAGLVLMFWSRPTGWVVVWTALVVALLLAVIEFLGGGPRPLPPPTATAEAPTVPLQKTPAPAPPSPTAGSEVETETPPRTEKHQTPSV